MSLLLMIIPKENNVCVCMERKGKQAFKSLLMAKGSDLVTTQMKNTGAIFVKVKIPSFTPLCIF